MEFHLLQHRKLSEVLSVPDGLQELMADIAREVIRYQPSNMESFIADYLESLVLARELMFVASKTADDILSNSMQAKQLMNLLEISVEDALAIIKVAEEEFRKNIASTSESKIITKIIQKCNLTVDQAAKISTVIEDSWRHFFRQNYSEFKCAKATPAVFDESIAKNTLFLHHKQKQLNNCHSKRQAEINCPQKSEQWRGDENWIKENFLKRERAAIAIQSWYREIKQSRLEKAALTIQSALKGLMARKNQQRLSSKATLAN